VFIVTVDHSKVYAAEPFLRYMRDPQANPQPGLTTEFTEVEVEFERDVSTRVTDPALKDAFLKDQRIVMEEIQQYLTARSIGLLPESKSKYAQAYEALFNRVRGRSARQSSTAFGGDAGRAADGNTDGAFDHGSVTHTNANIQAFWEVDLGAEYLISNVELWNRTDVFPGCCSQRLADFYVLVSRFPFTSSSLDAARTAPGVTTTFFTGPSARQTRASIYALGRYVRVQLMGQNYLSLAEVKVWGHSPSPGPIENLARLTGRSAYQSSTAFGGDAGRAADGNTGGTWANNSVTHTNLDSLAFWEVDTLSTHHIYGVELWNRTDCCSDRLADFYVFVSSSPISTRKTADILKDPKVVVTYFGPSKETPLTKAARGEVDRRTIRAPISAFGRYVQVRLKNPGYLSLAEVKVWGYNE
jgi:hypothetical protein